jgi:hypothetical protein
VAVEAAQDTSPVASTNELADLLRHRDELDHQIGHIVGHCARPGDVGRIIAAHVFDIRLAESATVPGHHGWFRSGPLGGRTVNIKTYGDARAGIDIGLHPCDTILVLSGPRRQTSVQHRGWGVSAAYLFETDRLLATLRNRGVKLGVATCLRKADLDAVQVFPFVGPQAPITLSDRQKALLSFFA